ncbi:MAG: 16S rRNA processing protein RimM [Bacteroidales bacterium]|nr:16S rRNA processing protein RimM [Bacteroidales bacterium]
MKDQFFYLGTLTRPFGLKGDLCAFFETDNPERYTQLDALFLDLDGEKIPYTIEHITYRGNNQFIIKFDAIGPDDCRDFVSVEVYLPMEQLPPLTGNQFYFHEVVGFTVTDQRLGEIGTCTGFLEVSNNPIMQVDHNGTEILIPASQQFVTHVDRENRTLHINTPEGLIEIYLGTDASQGH